MTWLNFPAWIPNKKHNIRHFHPKSSMFSTRNESQTRNFISHKHDWLPWDPIFFGSFGHLNLWAQYAESRRIRFGSGWHWITKKSEPVQNAAKQNLIDKNPPKTFNFFKPTKHLHPQVWHHSRDRPFCRLPDDSGHKSPGLFGHQKVSSQTSPNQQSHPIYPKDTQHIMVCLPIWMVNLYGKFVGTC